MNEYRNIGFICLVMTIGATSPTPLANNNVFAEFLGKAQLTSPNEPSVLVKRRIYEDNNDGQLKQISLKSLIGDLEKNIFASALNVTKDSDSKNVFVLEKKDFEDAEHQVETNSKSASLTHELIANSHPTDKTTHTPIQPNSATTHIVIDRIAIQPHTGGISLIPIFDLKRIAKDEDANNDHEVSKITISKTEITTIATVAPEPFKSIPQISSSTHIPTEVLSEASTTPKDVEQLKEVEEDLKEKVAEIEAEPIILSARV